MSCLSDVMEKVIDIVKGDTNLKGVYWGDQLAFSDYPVACVGAPISYDEEFPVIAAQKVWEEKYTIEIIIFVRFADTSINAKEIITLTDTLRNNLRGNLNLDSYVLVGDIGTTRYYIGTKTGDIIVRFSVTTVSYTKRIHSE